MRIVIPSVNYADLLEVTLPAWRAKFPEAEIVVVTSLYDLPTRECAEQHGARALGTDAWYRNGAKLDKACAINEAFAFDSLPDATLCLSVDADVVPFGRLVPRDGEYRVDTIYGAPRFHCPDERTFREHLAGRAPISTLGLLSRGADQHPVFPHSPDMVRAAAKTCQGYFQAFLSQPGRRFKSCPTAGGYDGSFARTFTFRDVLPDFYLLHLGGRSRRNWEGRVLPTWR